MQVEQPKSVVVRHEKKRPRFDVLKLLGTALAVTAVIFALAPQFEYMNRKLGVGRNEGYWIRYIIFYGLIGGGYLVFFYWKKFFRRRRP